ncbi:tRNA pseudouridine(55) synthase TruB [Paremcibacter congregatus]|uniref:tRNA pseudouridine synthase B n=1 Tax=Paremcibacter congregatus TaxID=2043170 RepID=A0A2G4YPG9_9PROT|nr:tRNA pseudouridine(55) synthase TruB [Paremcibacter congregatus]PHZ84187.1 tRNA pseudouridine(55) synthase TruB [Paremcibacter congregatus]QDE29079.1 tRNA pseudouridine(55) synthase TruB [Paremcibacter congregatus]
MGRKRKGNKVDGWLVIDKPLGMTSTQVVGKCRWVTKAQKIGHGGTLDPLASGILPIACGEATKTIPFIMDARKIYVFTVTFGESRSTDDAEGEIVATSDHRPGAADITEVLPEFIGCIQQIPPAYSAIKIDGKRAYDLARAGEDFEIKSRNVDIFDLKMLSLDGDQATLQVTCGKGTYVRSLARDLALRLNTVGYVSFLRRTAVGPFDLAKSISLEKLEELGHSAPPEDWILPVVTVLDDILALAVTEEQATLLSHGQALSVSGPIESGIVRAMAGERLVALCETDQNPDMTILRPVRVFNF